MHAQAAVPNGSVQWPSGSLLAGLAEPARHRLLALGTRSQYPDPGRVLIREGAATTSAFLLLSGIVKITVATDTEGALLAIRVGGDIVGELAALDERPRLATVTTAGPVTARVITQTEFNGLLGRDPELAKAISASIADKLRASTSRRVDFAACDVQTRLARILLELADRYGRDTSAGRTIGCALTQSELATLIAAGEPTVQRVLRQLKADGVVSTGYRSIEVTDIQRLREHAYPGRSPDSRP